MNYQIKKSPGMVKIALVGRMCFSDHAVFREIMKIFDLPAGESVVFDMSDLEIIDSSGLGMLIIARDESKKRGLDFIIENPKAEVRKLMDMAKFERFFTIRS
jgi:anti-anti-sigma factor